MTVFNDLLLHTIHTCAHLSVWNTVFVFYFLCVVVVVTFVQVCFGNFHSHFSQFEVHHSTVRKIIHKWKHSRQQDVPGNHPKTRLQTAKHPGLQASCSMLKVKGHDSTITNRLKKHGWFWFPGEKKIAAHLRFAKLKKTRLLEQIMRAKRRRLSTTQSGTFGEAKRSSSYLRSARWWRREDLVLFYSHRKKIRSKSRPQPDGGAAVGRKGGSTSC